MEKGKQLRDRVLGDLGELRVLIEQVGRNHRACSRLAESLARTSMTLESRLAGGLPVEAEKPLRVCAYIGMEMSGLGAYYCEFPGSIQTEKARAQKLTRGIVEAKRSVREQIGLGVDREGDLDKYEKLVRLKLRFDETPAHRKALATAVQTSVEKLVARAVRLFEVYLLEATYQL
jgi:hypothetical protein